MVQKYLCLIETPHLSPCYVPKLRSFLKVVSFHDKQTSPRKKLSQKSVPETLKMKVKMCKKIRFKIFSCNAE
jgi:hypothetical protein